MIVRKHETPKGIKRQMLGYKKERQTEFISSSLPSTICVHSATRHNIHMYPYYLFAAIRHLNRPRLSLSDLVAQSAE